MLRGALAALSISAAVWVAVAGWQFRKWTWQTTVPIRYTADIERGFQWGRMSLADGRDAAGIWHLYGLLNQYEKMEPEQPGWTNWLDYAPLRLAVMTAWAARVESQFPHVKHWADDRSYALTRPVLLVNTCMEVLAAVAAFGLVRSWVRRCEDEPLPWWRGSVLGLIAAAIFWLNAAVVLDAYGWPTWDVWVIPFFLLAAWAAVGERWWLAGVSIGIGAMFKGQELAMVPVFVVWALAAGRPAGAARFAIGVLIAIATITLPWLVSYIPPAALAAARASQMNHVHHPWDVPAGVFNIARAVDWSAIVWIAGSVGVAVAVAYASSMGILPMHFLRSKKEGTGKMPMLLGIAIPVCVVLAALAIVAWPWALKLNRSNAWLGVSFSILLLVASWFIRRRRALLLTAITALALLAAPSLFHGSYTWWTVGIGFGSRHWPRLFTGKTDNLPAILAYHFGWATDHLEAVVFTLPAKWLHLGPSHPVDVSISQLLLVIAGTLMLVASVGLGRHFVRRDRRFLVALITPWLLMYLIPAQMQERYLLFAAGAACVCIGDSIGTAALGLMLTLATFMTTLQTMLNDTGGTPAFGKQLYARYPSLFDADAGGKITRFLNGAHPDFGYALLLCGAVFLYLSVAPSRAVTLFDWRSRLPRRLRGRDSDDQTPTVTTPALPDAGRYPPHSETAAESANPSALE